MHRVERELNFSVRIPSQLAGESIQRTPRDRLTLRQGKSQCFHLKTQSPPGGLGRPSLSARLCISSWARTISSSESCAQRRSCSRSAPSQVVRLQSIASSSLRGIGKLSQILDVNFILRSAGDLFHLDRKSV